MSEASQGPALQADGRLSWRDDPHLPPRWRAFGEALVATRPEWEPFVLGPVAAYHPGYGEDDLRFVVEIPSAHPTIADPLVAELADPEHQGHIDVYWGEFFRHVGGRGITQEAHFARVVELLEGIADEARLVVWRRDESGRRTHTSLVRRPLERPVEELGAAVGGSLSVRSWRGTYDAAWPQENTDAKGGG